MPDRVRLACIHAIEYQDYMTSAQEMALQKQDEAAIAMDTRAMATASGERSKMRVEMSGSELQELKFK